MSEEEKKKLYIYILLASILSGGGSLGVNKFTSLVREDPFTGKQGQTQSNRIGENTKKINTCSKKVSHVYDQTDANTARLSNLEKNYVSRDYFKEKCKGMNDRVSRIELIDDNAADDRLQLFNLFGSLPPDDLIRRVTTLEVNQKYLKENLSILRSEIKK